MDTRRVLVVGGGIGGLTGALCFARSGFEVCVFERAADFTEVGAGIQVSPNASRVLHHLGLEGALREHGFLPRSTLFRHWRTGRVIAETPLGDAVEARYGAPYYHVHRGDLLAMLVAAADAEPRIQLHRHAQVQEISHDEKAVRVRLARGPVEHTTGDVLVGADGIRSLVRNALWGAAAPEFTGNVAWRALVPAERLPEGRIPPATSVWWGPGKHFVHYYVRGGRFVNCVCVVEKSGWEVESWTERGDHAELKEDFTDWHADVQMLIDAADPDSLYKWALFDRPPMARWSRGRATLLGDACHPTLPFMAQGAAMAIEDAAVLARCIGESDDVAASLQRYEGLRRQRTAAVQAGSRRNARVFHMTGLKAWARNRAARAAGGRAMETLFRYDALGAVDSEPKRTAGGRT